MAHLSTDLATLRANLELVERQIEAACERGSREPTDVTVCVATKYVDMDGLQLLKEAGVRVAAENRLQDMVAKQQQFRDDFEWHFIGAIQSRKAKEIAERVEVIHSLASESALARLAGASRVPRLLVQVNVSGEASKQGIAPEALGEFIASSPLNISGLMTMPPASQDPEDARPYFAALRELAEAHDLSELSIGTSQDFTVAVEEGATLIRLGSTLFTPPSQ
jgi:pyridoxal phosphate enzyme (YggS family)